MIILDEENAAELCNKYCRFPYTVEGDDLQTICEKCPLTVCEEGNRIERECEA